MRKHNTFLFKTAGTLLFLLAFICLHAQSNADDAWIAYHDAITHKYGYKDAKGNIKIKPVYDDTETDTFKTLALVRKYSSGGYVWINRKQKALFNGYLGFCGGRTIQNGYVRFKQNDKIGIADSTGTVLIPAQYNHILPFSGEYALFIGHGDLRCYNKGYSIKDCPESSLGWSNGRWGLIDKNNNVVIPAEIYESAIQEIDASTFTDVDPHHPSYITFKGTKGTMYAQSIQKQFELFLDTLLNEIENGNIAYFESICYPQVKCITCLLNTPQEYDSMVNAGLYKPGNMWTQIREQEVLPSAKFIAEDLELVFSKQNIAYMRDSSSIRNICDNFCNEYICTWYKPCLVYDNENTDYEKRFGPQAGKHYQVIVQLNQDSYYKGNGYAQYFRFMAGENGIKFTGYERIINGYGK